MIREVARLGTRGRGGAAETGLVDLKHRDVRINVVKAVGLIIRLGSEIMLQDMSDPVVLGSGLIDPVITLGCGLEKGAILIIRQSGPLVMNCSLVSLGLDNPKFLDRVDSTLK
jgi:hypothetical protein